MMGTSNWGGWNPETTDTWRSRDLKIVKGLRKCVESTAWRSMLVGGFNDFFIYFYHFCYLFFPTCQVRVVRFYHSCSPPQLAILLLLLVLLLLLLLRLLLQFLFDHVCINFHLNFRLANSSPSSLPTSQLSVHRWASTWDLPSSVRTAGPQPGTFPAQCAPLDLNLGPSELSAHRWTSTWDLPSSVHTVGPQPGTFPAQCTPLDLNGQIECQIKCQKICQIECQKICQNICQ